MRNLEDTPAIRSALVGPARAAAPYPRLLGRRPSDEEEPVCAREPAKLTVGLSVATGGERSAASPGGWHAQVPAKVDLGSGGPAARLPARVGAGRGGPPDARSPLAPQGPLGPPSPHSPRSPQRRAAALLSTAPPLSGGTDPDACGSPAGLADASQRLSPAGQGQLMWPAELPCQPLEEAYSPHAPPAAALGIAPLARPDACGSPTDDSQRLSPAGQGQLMWPSELPCQPLEEAHSPYAPPAAALGIDPPPGLPVPQVGGEEVGPLAASCRRTGQGDRRFTCKFIFVGIQADRDASFEIVPRLIGRGGCNMRTISEACGGKVRIRGRGSGHRECSHNRRRSAEADVPLQIALSCRDQPSLDQGRELLTHLLAEISEHFARYCRSRGLEPPTEKSPLFSVVLGA